MSLYVNNPPFLAETPLAVAYKQVHDHPPMVSQIRKDVPKRLELIVAKCLKKNKAERYQNASELLNDLDSVDLSEFSAIGTTTIESSQPNRRITRQKRF